MASNLLGTNQYIFIKVPIVKLLSTIWILNDAFLSKTLLGQNKIKTV